MNRSGLRILDQDRERERERGDSRTRIAGRLRDGLRSERGENHVAKIAVQRGSLGQVQLREGDQVHAVQRELLQAFAQTLLLPGMERPHTLPERDQPFFSACNALFAGDLYPNALERGHADGEELVGIGAHDREVLQSLEQRCLRIFGDREDASVELEEAEIAIEESFLRADGPGALVLLGAAPRRFGLGIDRWHRLGGAADRREIRSRRDEKCREGLRIAQRARTGTGNELLEREPEHRLRSLARPQLPRLQRQPHLEMRPLLVRWKSGEETELADGAAEVLQEQVPAGAVAAPLGDRKAQNTAFAAARDGAAIHGDERDGVSCADGTPLRLTTNAGGDEALPLHSADQDWPKPVLLRQRRRHAREARWTWVASAHSQLLKVPSDSILFHGGDVVGEVELCETQPPAGRTSREALGVDREGDDQCRWVDNRLQAARRGAVSEDGAERVGFVEICLVPLARLSRRCVGGGKEQREPMPIVAARAIATGNSILPQATVWRVEVHVLQKALHGARGAEMQGERRLDDLPEELDAGDVAANLSRAGHRLRVRPGIQRNSAPTTCGERARRSFNRSPRRVRERSRTT